MKKFLIASLIVTIAFSSHLQARLVHEWTVDLYYANGVLADARNSERENWTYRSNDMQAKYPSLKKALKFGEAKLSYNASYLWGISDLTEVILQYRAEHPAAEITWQVLSNKKGSGNNNNTFPPPLNDPRHRLLRYPQYFSDHVLRIALFITLYDQSISLLFVFGLLEYCFEFVFVGFLVDVGCFDKRSGFFYLGKLAAVGQCMQKLSNSFFALLREVLGNP